MTLNHYKKLHLDIDNQLLFSHGEDLLGPNEKPDVEVNIHFLYPSFIYVYGDLIGKNRLGDHYIENIILSALHQISDFVRKYNFFLTLSIESPYLPSFTMFKGFQPERLTFEFHT